MKNIKSKNGITLAMLAIFIVLALIVLGVLGTLVTNFRKNLDNVKTDSSLDIEFDKLNVQLLKEVENDNNEIQIWKCSTNKIVFFDGIYKKTYSYNAEDKSIYMNDYIKVASNIDLCSFSCTEENGKQKLTISVEVNGKQRVSEYIMARSYDEEMPERPDLLENMIPVKWNGTSWVKADAYKSDWYEYGTTDDTKRWANAVTVKETGTNTRAYYLAAEENTVIVQDDIVGMFVWIPRYRYKILRGYHQSNTGNSEESSGYFDIQFLRSTEGGTIEYNSVSTNNYTEFPNGYVLHPAFQYNNKNISGFWYGKFEASSSDTTDTKPNITNTYGASTANATFALGVNEITVRPNVTSWRSTRITRLYTACKNITHIDDTTGIPDNIHGLKGESHLSIDVEWAAVAYLTQSDYGNAQISSTTGVWTNSFHEGNAYYATRTGMVGSSRDQLTLRSLIQSTRSVDEDGVITINYTDESTRSFYPYNSTNGIHGSTTGTIYGIYDMAGGAWEYQSSYLTNESTVDSVTWYSNIANVPLINKTSYVGGTNNKSDNYTLNKATYGNMLYETSADGSGTTSWNGDFSEFLYSSGDNNYIFRVTGGGFYTSAGDLPRNGIFCFHGHNGDGAGGHTCRPTLMDNF